jgi:hypothetical protein
VLIDAPSIVPVPPAPLSLSKPIVLPSELSPDGASEPTTPPSAPVPTLPPHAVEPSSPARSAG